MKFLLFTIGALLAPRILIAQNSSPDTLKIDIKKHQQLILIGNDLKSFERLNIDSIIRKSLAAVKDSLAEEDKGSANEQPKNFKKSLEFGFQLGAGLVQDKPSPALNFYMNIPLNKLSAKSKSKHYSFLGLDFTNNYLFQEDMFGKNRLFINGFAGLSFRQYKYKNEDGKESKAFIGDAGIAYRIKGGNQIFQKDTFKLYSSGPAFKNSLMRFELYFENNFKRIYPGFTYYF